MQIELTREHQKLSAKAREFCEQVLQPHELEVEEQHGLPEASRRALRKAVCDWGFAGINHRVEDGGQGYSIFEQMLINEQLGRATCGLWAAMWQPAISLRFGSEEQKQRYLRPSCRGERRGCFAISEPEAGSDPRRVRTEALRDGDGYVLSGEKWFVTSYNACDYVIVHAHVDGDPDKPTLFLVDKDTPGVRHIRSPHFMHTYIFDHAEIALEEVRLPASARLGEIGQGFALTKDWFVEARLQIAAHCVGAATRAAEVANDYAAERVQFDRPIREFQAIEFSIADMATEIMAGKSLLYRVAAEIGPSSDPKRIHARVSALKLFCSEMAGRVVDRALQVLGGRGYMRENPVERLYRDLRVDRIWEGTSEIQRAIIGGQIKKRGLGVYTDW
ncbi:MAG TPA: acyl-CoA dehydrogenase [Myxococcota bacterium]|nr:acyl-CoA dehydrogenase [Myxococcota bacterium]